MEWLAPITGAIAAAVAVPALVLLYFLKLKRQERLISSTLLWKRAVRDLQVNAPFQRIRRNLLLLLQLIALAAVLVALARPVLSLHSGPGRRYVLLIDRSASMSAADAAGRTRLEEAKRQARVLIDSMRGPSLLQLSDKGDEAMVLAFDSHAKVMCNFTADKAQLAAAVDAIEPTDGPTSLAEAISVARAFAQSAGADENNRSATESAQLELFSDGRVADLKDVAIAPGELVFHCVGSSADNVGVVAMQARRSYEKADEVHVFASLANYGPKPADCEVQLAVNGSVRAVRTVRVPETTAPTAAEPQRVGKLSVSFVLTQAGEGVVAVRQLRKDILASDDAAWAILPPPRKLTVLLVTAGNPALQTALGACPLARLDVRSPADFDKEASGAAPAVAYDVILLDGHAPAKLPRGRYIIFGPPPPDLGAKVTGTVRGYVLDWRNRHPILQFVNLGNLFVAKSARMALPRDAAVLAEFGDGPAMALLRRQGSVFLLVGFDVLESNWPFDPGFVMFCYNATNFLGMELGQERQAELAVGEAITVRAGEATEAAVTDPAGKIEKVVADPSGMVRYPRTDRVGIYRVEVAGRPAERVAVNLLDEAESHVAPLRDLQTSSRTIQAQSAEPRRTNQELWPYLALAALAMVCVEWIVYNSRVRL